MPNRGMSRVGAAIASLTMCAVMAGPAQALTDTAVDMSGRNVSFDTIFVNQPADDIGAMPDNPAMELPDEVSEDLPDDAMVVSPDLAVTEEGKIKDLETGETVTTEELVGTPDTQPDPLAKTNGESFIPVEVGEVKEAVKESEQTSSESGQTGGEAAAVRPIALEGNEYGAYWGTYNNTPAFFESDGTLFVQQAKGVIDVSEWQGEIDWEAAKNAGVEGAIIRISYGWNNGFDKYALRNISECKRLGIPFGIYSYSYSYDKATATAEVADIVSLLRKAGGRGVGLAGVDGSLFEAVRRDEEHGNVGNIVRVNPDIVFDVLEKGYIPVVSSIAAGIDQTMNYNINADFAAEKLAIALHAKKFILLTDVKGLMRDFNDEDSLIREVKVSQVPGLMKEGVISGGMIPKVQCCVEAIRQGVHTVNIQDGRIPHSILIEILSNEGIGTVFY